MINLTRRNFLLGVASSGLLTLLPPALAIPEVKKLVVEKPELITGFIRGVLTGGITRETTPGPHDMSFNNFTLTTEAHTRDVTPICSEYRHAIISYVDWAVEAWVRSTDMYCGRLMRLSLQAGPDIFYRGDFYITEHKLEFNEGAAS